MEGKENSKMLTLQILGKEKDRVRLDRATDSWISLNTNPLDCMHAKHRKSLEFIRFSTAEKSNPPPEMEIGNEMPAMLERRSRGDTPGLH